jgi:hypothetical protein
VIFCMSADESRGGGVRLRCHTADSLNLSLNLFHQTGHGRKIHQTSRIAFDASDDKFALLFTTFIRLGECANGHRRRLI